MREKSNVVIINEALAQRYFPNEDPLGKSLVIAMTDPNVPTEIIGIVGDVKFADLRDRGAADDVLAAPAARLQRDDADAAHRADPAAFAPLVEREVRAIDKDQPVADVRTMDQWVGADAVAGAVQLDAADDVRRRWRWCWRRSASTA